MVDGVLQQAPGFYHRHAGLQQQRARGRSVAAASNDHRVDFVPDEIAGKWRLKERARHSFGELEVARRDLAARVVRVAFGPVFNVLQRVGRVGARPPHTRILAVNGIADTRPDDRHPLEARETADRIDMLDLARVGFIRGLERMNIRIRPLEIDVDDGELRPETKLRSPRIGHHIVENLARGAVIGYHVRANHRHWPTMQKRLGLVETNLSGQIS